MNNLIKDTDSQKELVKLQTQLKLGSKDESLMDGGKDSFAGMNMNW